MGSQTLDILRQGVWASLCGGWFYDPYQPVLSNTLHLYTFIILIIAPFVIHLYIHTVWSWALYSGFVGLSFALIKYFNSRLHHLFDTSEGTEEIVSGDPLRHQDSGSFGGITAAVVAAAAAAANNNHHASLIGDSGLPNRDILVHQAEAGAIELQDLGTSAGATRETPERCVRSESPVTDLTSKSVLECSDFVTWPEREIPAAFATGGCQRTSNRSGSGSLASVEPRKPKADRSMSFDEQRIRHQQRPKRRKRRRRRSRSQDMVLASRDVVIDIEHHQQGDGYHIAG